MPGVFSLVLSTDLLQVTVASRRIEVGEEVTQVNTHAHSTAGYCTLLQATALHCTTGYCTILQATALHYRLLYYTEGYCAALQATVLY